MRLDDVFKDEFCAFDLETSGFNSFRDQILQIGLVFVEDTDFIVETESILLNPNFPYEYHVPVKITELTGITSREVSEIGMDPATMIPYVNEKIRNTNIVTHNGIAFDKKFWDINCRKYETLSPWNGRWQDTAILYKAMKLDELGTLAIYDTFVDFSKTLQRPIKGLKYNLKLCCSEMSVDVSDIEWHTALADSLATQRLFLRFGEDLFGW